MALSDRRLMYLPFGEVQIRGVGPADADAVGRMHYAAWREAYSELLPADFWSDAVEERWADRWVAQVAAPSEAVVRALAERDRAVIGLAVAAPAEPNPTAGAPVRERELQAMYVLATEHGSGIAAQLLDAVLPDDEPAQLWVFEANPRARAFYEKHGFRADGARHVFGPGLGDQPEIRMVR